MTKQIEIKGVIYNVVGAKDFEHNGNKRVGLTLQRPKGRRFYFAVQYENGVIGEAV